MIAAAILMLAAAGIGMVRHGWGRSRAEAVAGWMLAGVAALLLTSVAGAWGLAVVATSAMAVALALLLVEAWRTPAGRAVPVRSAPAVALPRPHWRSIGRRIAVFALVVPAGAVASALLAFGAQAAGRRLGWVEADTTVLALFLQPVAWTLLATVQMTRTGAAAMVAPGLACAAAGGLLWWPL